MANTGILYRRNVKSFFEKDNNKPIEGEIVYATDTHEYGALDEDGSIVWRPHEGSVVSINGRQGEIHLDKVDVGLSNVDNTSDNDKPLSSAIKKELKEHYEATNPHHVTPQQIGLGNVENTSDIDKPISRLTQTALDLKLDKSAIPANAKFTDTTYEIKDGELSEYNFNKSYKDKLDYLSTNRQLLSAGNALRAQGRNIILTRADGSTETIETQDTIYDDTNVLQTLSNILTKFDALNIKDNLNSENGVLSAKQGKILNDKITEIKEMLKSDNVDLDSLQEIVTFIENNKHLIDSLEIDNIANLRNVLNSKCDFVNEQGTVRNALNFDNHEISDFVMKRDYLNYKNNIDNSIATINTNFSNYYTKSETDSKIQLAVDSIDYSDINRKIDNNFNTLNDKISAIDYTYIATDLQNAKTQLEAKDLEIQTDLTNKYSELKTTINSINFAQINSDIANLNKLIKDNSLSDLNTNVTNNKAKIDEILNNLQLYLKKSEFTDEINKEYAQNIEPKINEKISRLVTQNDLLNKTTELNTLITKLQEKLNSTNSDLNDVEDDISNIYHLLHNVKVDLSSYYTKAEVDAKVAAGGTFDASQYYNKAQVDAKIPNVDLTNYYPKTQVYNKSEVDSKIPDVSTLAKKSEVYNKTDTNVLLHDYAKKIDLPDLSRYYEKSQIEHDFVSKSELSILEGKVNTNSSRIVDTYTKTETYNKSEVDSKIAASGTFDASQYYNKSEAYNKSEIDTKIAKYYTKTEADNKYALFTDLNRYHTTNVADMKYATKLELQNISSILQTFALKSDVYVKSFIDIQLRNKPNYGEVYTRREIDNKLSTLGSFNASLYYPKTEVYSKSETDAKIPNLSEYVKNNYTATDLQLNTNVKIKGTLQKDNSEVGDPDEDYITTKYFGESFPIFFMQKINEIAGGSVNNFVLKQQKYTSPAYTFTEKTNEVSLAITDGFAQFNNFVITFTDTPNKLVLSGPQIGQSGVIKVINAKKINGYDSNLKSTVTLPVLDKLNDTEYFSYYVFSESEILFSRI